MPFAARELHIVQDADKRYENTAWDSIRCEKREFRADDTIAECQINIRIEIPDVLAVRYTRQAILK